MDSARDQSAVATMKVVGAIADPHPSRTFVDVFVWLVVLGLGALQFGLYERATDFVHDANYSELARSILENGSYGYNFKAETVLPPGLPLILAFICATVGCTYS